MEAILAGFVAIREIVEIEVEKYVLLAYQQNLVEYILQWDSINKYTYPLCFREIDDDLSVEPADAN